MWQSLIKAVGADFITSVIYKKIFFIEEEEPEEGFVVLIQIAK